MKFSTLILLVSSVFAKDQDKKPNIVMILADQVRWDMLGTYGNEAVSTPNLDKLAKQGVQFDKCYSSTPICTPARAILLTGLKPWNNGMLAYGDLATQYSQEMIQAFKDDLGYHTAIIGKNHFGWNTTTNEGIAHGFEFMNMYDGLTIRKGDLYDDDYDRWFNKVKPGVSPFPEGLDWNSWQGKVYPYEEHFHPTFWIGNQTIDYIENYEFEDKPLFLKSSFHRPHSPYDPPQRLIDQVDPDKIKEPSVGNGWDEKFKNDKACGGVDAWCGEFDQADVNVSKRYYHANLNFVDEQIGLIMDSLERRGVLNNSIILFTSDHGDMQSDHYLWRKGYPYEGSTHIPMIMSWPKNLEGKLGINVKQGTKLDTLMELRDVFPTLYDAAGGDLNKYAFDGSSIMKLLNDPTTEWREWLDMGLEFGMNLTMTWNGITDGRYKYAFWALEGTESLFDLQEDPNEHNDIAASNSDLVTKFRNRLIEQYQDEQRDERYIKDGVLQKRKHVIKYSPHQPKSDPEVIHPYDYEEVFEMQEAYALDINSDPNENEFIQ